MKFKSKIEDLDTPALLVGVNVMEKNLLWGQQKANSAGVKLRPHIKTHRTPALAKKQIKLGAKGITVAKLGEAEVMAKEDIDDIFIANEIVGKIKIERLYKLNRQIHLATGIDSPIQAKALSEKFAREDKPIEVLIDVDTGDARTGIQPGQSVLELANLIIQLPGLKLRGIFTHDGHSYRARDVFEVKQVFKKSQEEMLQTANILRLAGIQLEEISVGSTPSFLVADILSGITEVRPGTYIFLDAAQGNLLRSYERCALTVLTTITNRPTPHRVVIDAGTKALSVFVRGMGVCQTQGFGLLKEKSTIYLESLSDEHGVFSTALTNEYPIGDKLQIIPNHACPTCNLYDYLYGVRDCMVVNKWPITARGKSQ
ncbi:D-threonine aldolase [subsurface metagenome]